MEWLVILSVALNIFQYIRAKPRVVVVDARKGNFIVYEESNPSVIIEDPDEARALGVFMRSHPRAIGIKEVVKKYYQEEEPK
jgi:hypothetical protein